MSDNVFFQAVGAIMKGAWTMITTVKFPGTEMSIAMILIGAAVAAFSIRLITIVFSMSISAGGTSRMMNDAAEKIGKRSGRF